MNTTTRGRMVAGAVDLIRRRGVNATSVREVVRQTGTPRGSIRHHFPQGKLQLVEEAVELATREVSAPLGQLTVARGVIAGLGLFIAAWGHRLEESGFEAGCPVLAVAVEQYLDEDGNPHAEGESRLRGLADAAFQDWQEILAAALEREGVAGERARRLANLVIAAVEGSVAMCRAARSTAPLEEIRTELELAIKAVLPAR